MATHKICGAEESTVASQSSCLTKNSRTRCLADSSADSFGQEVDETLGGPFWASFWAFG
jgi:hypothetical protein